MVWYPAGSVPASSVSIVCPSTSKIVRTTLLSVGSAYRIVVVELKGLG